MIIRQAATADAPLLVEFLRQFRAEGLPTVLRHETLPSVLEEEEFINRLSGKAGLVLIAVNGEAVVGCLSAEVRRHPQLQHSCEFGLSVLRSQRSAGVGSALIDGLLEWARSAGLRRAELTVFSNNPEAIRLYQRLGFREEGRKRQAVRVEEEFVDLMEMVLVL